MQHHRWETLSAAHAAGTALLVVGLAGCPPPRADLGMYTGSDATTTADQTGASVASSAEVTSSQDPDGSTSETTSTGTTGAVGSSTTETGATTDTTGAGDSSGSTGEPALLCEPEGRGRVPFGYASVGFQPQPPVVDGKFDFSAMCTVFGVLVAAGGEPHRVEMQCGATTVTILLYIPVAELQEPPFDHPLQFKFVHRMGPWWSNDYFTLVDTLPETPMLKLAGFSGETATSPEFPDFFAPLGIEGLAGVCTGPIECPYPFERLGVRFSHGASQVVLTDNTSGDLGDGDSFRVLLERARRYVPEVDDNNNELCPGYTDPMPVEFAGVIVGQN